MRSLLVFFASSLVVVTAACAAPGDAPDSASDSAEAEQGFTVDIPESERLLSQAVVLAERHAKGDVCDDTGNGEPLRSSIVDLLRKAIAVRDTVYFRTQVIGKKAILAQELASTLEWQEILGVFKPTDLRTLPTALSTGVTIWDTNGGVYGNKAKIAFAAHGKAVVSTLNIDTTKPVWESVDTTWTYANGTLSLGTGLSFHVTYGDGMLEASPEDGTPPFISQESECEA